MKNTIALILAVALMFSLTVTAFAADELGSITINGIVEGDTVYEIYRMLDLESYDIATGAYSYTVNSAWVGFFEEGEAGASHMKIEDGYVTWIAAEDDDTKANFAKAALKFAQENHISPVKSSKTDGEFVITTDPDTNKTSGKFSDLPLGYYLVDSSVGALCGLTTTNPDASINAKSGIPTVDKQVIEDSTNSPGATNTADIGQMVEFRTTISVHAGAQNYVLHDKMSKGLSFEHSNEKAYENGQAPVGMENATKGVWKIEHIVPGVGTTNLTEGVDFKVLSPSECGKTDCTFDIIFYETFCNKLETNDKIVVHYNAMLNREAIVAKDGNPNETWLDFGEENESNHDTTQTYTFGIDIVKTDSQNNLIDGAEFKVYDAATGGNEIPVVKLILKDDEGNELPWDGVTYRRAKAGEEGAVIVVTNGKVRVVGFDNGTYYLEETTAPDGYNKLTTRQRFIIADGNLDATFNDGIYSTGSGVHVVNKTGSILPETGGMGTTLFITFGLLAVLGTGVLLVTKKRMGMIQD